MKNKITILIVNFNSADFVKISLYALSKLTKNSYEVYILDNGSLLSDFNALKQYVKIFNNVNLERKETRSRGSKAHGEALNYLVKKVKTPYFCIMDADAIWLKKDWDEILINKLDQKVKIIGTQYAPPKYDDFPSIFAVLFETKAFKCLEIDLRPDISGRTINKDTSQKMKAKYLKAGYTGKVLRLKNTRWYKKGPFNNLIVAEYYLDQKCRQIVASHFGRGSTGGMNKYLNKMNPLIFQIPYIGSLFAHAKAIKEKNEWMKICKRIIENQK